MSGLSCIRLSGRFGTSVGGIKRLRVEGTSCPLQTSCLDSHIIEEQYASGRCVGLFRDHDLDPAFAPQDVDSNIRRMAFKREINFRISNSEMRNLDVIQEGRQDRL